MSKLTMRLQITDTDVAKSFKAYCRAKMEELSAAKQAELRASGSSDVWQADAEAILESVQHSQNKLSEKNDETELVLGAARRNFHSAYQPTK